MFGPDPIDLYDPSPYWPMAYYSHLLIGVVALTAALLAFSATKRGQTHRLSGYVYMSAVGVVCLTSISMLQNVFIPPLFMAVFTALYCIGAPGWPCDGNLRQFWLPKLPSQYLRS